MKNKKLYLAFSLLICSVLLLAGCNNSTGQQEQSQTQVSSTLKGFGLSPLSFSGNEFPAFFSKAMTAGNTITWPGDWNQLGDLEKGGPAVVATLASTFHYSPVIEVGAFAPSNGSLLRPLNDENIKNYQDSAVAFVKKFKPKYFGIGVEVNTMFKKNPKDFDSFVKLFNDTAKLIKAASPDTKVFTTFQLEEMKGLNGGLFGGKNDPNDAQWDLLSKFTESDLAAFTTYPYLIYHNPSEIPADYYTDIKNHTDKPIAFTEIGWPSDNIADGWESTPQNQADFIDAFSKLTKDVNPVMKIWSFLYDQNIPKTFASDGLIGRDGTEKPGLAEWQKVN